MVNAQEWLDKKYPKEIRNSIKNLFIREKDLEGDLELIDFINLEKLDCSYNQLTSLKFYESTQLKRLDCNDNYLTNLDYSSLSDDKLIFLDLSNNNFVTQNLSHFSKFTNLRVLWISNTDEEKIKKGIYNRFYGSLEPLKNLTNLEELHIGATDIDSGVNYLPDDFIERIYYSSKERPESQVKKITEQLNSFLNRKISRDWKEIHLEFDEQKKKEWGEKMGFSYHETKEWINKAGLQPDDYHFAACLRRKGYKPQQILDQEKLRKEDKGAQVWFDNEYPLAERKWINWLDISRIGLKGDLIINDFPNLEKLDCYYNQLTSLTLNNLPNLDRFNAYNNKLSSLIVKNSKVSSLNVRNNSFTSLGFFRALDPNELISINVSNNNLSPCDIVIFNNFENLKGLYLSNNSFLGNLKPLGNLSKMEVLDISNTDIYGGLEYLSDNLKKIFCDSKGEDYACSKIQTQLKNYLCEGGYGYDFSMWKEANKEKVKSLISAIQITDYPK